MAVTHLPEPHPTDPVVEQLLRIYREAYDATLRDLQRAVVAGLATAHRVALLQQLSRRVGELRAQTLAWAYGPVDPETGQRRLSESALRMAVAMADRETLRQLAAIGLRVEVPPRGAVSPSFSLLHDQALRVVAENIVLSLDAAIEQFDRSVRGIIGRAANDVFRLEGLETVGQKLAQGLTVRQGRARLVNELTEQGIVAFTDSRGRTWNLKSYADMVVRTTTREATHEATLRRLEAEGHDLVILTEHRPTCAMCATVQGRVFSISGSTPGYPKLDFPVPVHPNCGHSAVPYSPKYDPNAEETRRLSNMPRDIDPRSEREVELYERAQKIKAEQRRKRQLTAQMNTPGLDPEEKERLRKLRAAANRRLIELNRAQRKALPGWR